MKSVRTSLRVFEEVAARQPVGLSELSRRLDVPKASVQRALTTLADIGWLRHDVNRPGQWVVTARFSVLADADPEVIAVRDAARPVLVALRESGLGWSGLFVLDGDRMVLVAGPDETTLRSLAERQGPLPVHVSAAGRAILARLPEATTAEALARLLPDDDRLGDHVRTAVADARRLGYAVVAGEYDPELGVVSAPVLDRAGAPIAALAVMVPVARLADGGGDELGRALLAAADRVATAVAGPSPVA